MKQLNEYISEALIKNHITPSQIEYVDLGLPSGNMWATDNYMQGNEYQFYSFPEVKKLKFNDNQYIPNDKDCEELLKYCNDEWDRPNRQYLLTGPNGNTISFKAIGYYIIGDENIKAVDNPSGSDVWTSTSSTHGKDWGKHLYFIGNSVGHSHDAKLPIRLIKKQ